jgi:hypothetical protein
VRELRDGQLVNIPVEVGITSDSETEIVSGVAENDTVVTAVVSAVRSTTGATTSPFSAFGGRGAGNAVFRAGGR